MVDKWIFYLSLAMGTIAEMYVFNQTLIKWKNVPGYRLCGETIQLKGGHGYFHIAFLYQCA